MEEPRGLDPEELEKELRRLEQAIGERLEEILGSKALHYTVTVKAVVSQVGLSQLSVDVEAVRPGFERIDDIVDAVVEEEVRKFEERLGLRGSRKKGGRKGSKGSRYNT